MTIQRSRAQSISLKYLTNSMLELYKQHRVSLPAHLSHLSNLEADAFKGQYICNTSSELLLVEHFLQCAPQVALAQELAESSKISSFGCLGYAMLTAPNLEQALSLIQKHPALIGEYFDFEIAHADGVASLTINANIESRPLRHAMIEVFTLSLIKLCNEILASPIRFEAIHLNYVPSGHFKKNLREHLGIPLSLESDTCKIIVLTSDLIRPLPMADELCHAEMVGVCQAQENELAPSRNWLKKFTELLGLSLNAPPSMEQLAKQMCCSPRTLRRQLDQHATSYRAELDTLRFSASKDMLSQGVPMDTVAERLGFSDRVAFNRAFKRWAGLPPQTFRATPCPASTVIGRSEPQHGRFDHYFGCMT